MSRMDGNSEGHSLNAPDASGLSPQLPDRGPFPRVDDHLVEPEVTRDEIIGGRRVVALPAEPPRAIQRTRLNYLVLAHVAAGYSAASGLLTRYDEESDFATDTCIFKDEIDPETGDRYLEEVAFFVVAEQNERDVQEKVPRMYRRGVRRVFAVFIEGSKRVCEWSAESEGWSPLGADTMIEDSCFVTPFPVTAFFDRAAADKAVRAALVARGKSPL